MGKTEKGAVWLDPNLTSPYEFYQYWRNVEDQSVSLCLRAFTFLDIKEINRLIALQGSEINEAKKVLAYEMTALIHGKEEAENNAEDSSREDEMILRQQLLSRLDQARWKTRERMSELDQQILQDRKNP